ncbi:HEAT repeat domain-containing protein [Tundrisphaera sp. TA3]|uniref:HEAT repeat domain-containing protein n=1 Tax=Tundrisphaera sp. TA3 TaxID=3435775 RepID=UPI003EBBEE86
MRRPRLRLRMWHLIGLVAAFAAYLAVMRYRQEVYDPAASLARRLRSFDPAERIKAAERLSSVQFRAESAINPLLEAIEDADPTLRARAAMALPNVLRDHNHPRADEVRATLEMAMAGKDPGARHAAAVALAMLQPDAKTISPALIEAAGDADPMIRSEAVGLMGTALDDEAVWSTILGATRDPDLDVRNQAIRVLGWTPRPSRLAAVREALAPALKESNEVNRGFAANILGNYSQLAPGDVPEFYDTLSDPSPFVRRMACKSLPHRPGARPAVPILIHHLGDPAPEVRRAAAGRLGSICLDAEAALPDLRRAAEDKEGIVREAASEAIRRIEGKASAFRTKLLPGAVEDLASPDPEARRGAAEILGTYGPHSAPAVPALIRCLDDPEAAVRIASAHALGRIGPAAREALPALDARAADPDERVRQAAEAAAQAIRVEAGGP